MEMAAGCHDRIIMKRVSISKESIEMRGLTNR